MFQIQHALNYILLYLIPPWEPVSGLGPGSYLSPDLQVAHTTWPEKFGIGSAAHGVVTDMLSDLRKDMGDWMKHRKLNKQVS